MPPCGTWRRNAPTSRCGPGSRGTTAGGARAPRSRSMRAAATIGRTATSSGCATTCARRNRARPSPLQDQDRRRGARPRSRGGSRRCWGCWRASMTLAVDGNGTFDRDTALSYIEALADYPLAWIEEPVHPLDYELHRELAGRSRLPIATGENICSRSTMRATSCAMAACARIATSCSSTSRSATASSSIGASSTELAAFGWRRERCAPHAGHLLAMQAVAGLGLGLAETAMDTDDAVRRGDRRRRGERRHGAAAGRARHRLRGIARLSATVRRARRTDGPSDFSGWNTP